MLASESVFNITVVGGGYVGCSLSCMLAANHDVVLLDVDRARVEEINHRLSPIEDTHIDRWFENHANLSLSATTRPAEAYNDPDIVFVAVPTDFSESRNAFDTSAVEGVIKSVIQYCPQRQPIIVIKSTVPVGFTERMRSETGYRGLLFCPEFLREGKALYDCLHPNRIIVGTDMDDPALMQDASLVCDLMLEGCSGYECPSLIVNSSEAEAIKLFSNAYLALRVSFFNELDCFAELSGLNAGEIIRGMGLDSRIGQDYNNPSFGYGGYCLPKDTRQLLAQFSGIPQNIISAIVESNQTRMDHISAQILSRAKKISHDSSSSQSPVIGVYRLNMKAGSDNCRHSATLEVLKRISGKGFPIEIYEPFVDLDNFDMFPECEIQNDLDRFKSDCQIILANRFESCLEDVKEKVYTRDQFHTN